MGQVLVRLNDKCVFRSVLYSSLMKIGIQFLEKKFPREYKYSRPEVQALLKLDLSDKNNLQIK